MCTRACLLASLAWLVTLSSHAGTISFSYSLTGSTLTATEQGDSSAFYPQILRLRSDGQWEPLSAAPGSVPTAEMVPGDSIDLTWPPEDSDSPVSRMQAVMVRFFDQAGVRFGQIATFNPPPAPSQVLKVTYQGQGLVIEAPKAINGPQAIRSTWVLWPQEDGIASIKLPINLNSHQPAARHFVWHGGMGPVPVDTGAALPNVMLIHETAEGLKSQSVPGGGLAGRQQRVAWLDAGTSFYRMALLALAVAVGSLLFCRLKAIQGEKSL